MSSAHPNDPLHGLTLEALVTALVERLGWEALARRLPIPPFVRAPTIASSLKFLRRHPPERAAVEGLYRELVAGARTPGAPQG